jgi:MFS family permease
MPLAARRLLAARFWRSIAHGTLVVDLTLYLNALHWPGAVIGGVLGAAGVTAAILSVGVGLASDRLGRKPFLMAYEALCCLCGLVAFFARTPVLLGAAIILADFGRGANGAAGPMAPAEDGWMAEVVEPRARGYAFSVKSAIGFCGMAIGALLAMLPALWQSSLGPAACYRPIFLIVILGNATNLFILARVHEPSHTLVPKEVVKPRDSEPQAVSTEETDARENQFLRRLMALNALNGFSVGLTSPLMAYWFEQRFHVGPVEIAPVIALTCMGIAAVSLFNGVMTQRVGLVNSVVWARGSGLVLLFLLPLMPFYFLAATFHVLRSALSLGTIGARQALVASAVRNKRRGLASSVNIVSGRFPQSLGPVVAGALIGAGRFVMPFCLAAACQGIYVYLFGHLFRRVEEKIDEEPCSQP